uniref:Phosphatidylinositol 4-phosphate 5-kinase 6 n=1 Tax=Tanacetum cinerariifolium TaxID=118510 RepID=A0A6L2K624_TANCI|nr:phosphatidylinositol 4-phosphate 5-kinase 6 [Tanacetum cinerariifolium]
MKALIVVIVVPFISNLKKWCSRSKFAFTCNVCLAFLFFLMKSKHTSPHQPCDFEFKDYFPLVFRKLMNFFNVVPADYVLSICRSEALFSRKKAAVGPSDTPLCYLCTYEQCGNILIDGTCSKCNSGARNSFVYDPNPKSLNEVQGIFNLPLLPHYNIYLCQLCESNSHYGYEYSQRIPLVYEPEPCYNQSFGDNDYPHDSPGVTPHIDHQCCYKCGNSLDDFFCYQCTYEFCGKAIAITLDLPTVEPEDPLRMGEEHLDAISKTESDEFIKSSIENLVLNLSESKDECECDVPACDDFTTFSNLLFDADDDFSSSDKKSFSDKDIPKEIYSNPLFDEEIISIKIDPHHFNDEDEIDLSLTLDDSIPPRIEDDDCDSEGDILILEELLSNYSLSLPENESFHFDIPSSPRPLAKPPDDDVIESNSGILTVVGDISGHYVPIPRLLPT